MGQAILALSEDQTIREILLRLLASAGLSGADSTGSPAAILLGCRRHIAKNDLAAAQTISRNGHKIPIILITSQGSEELAVEALRAGITNYLRLPLTPEELVRAIEVAAPHTGGARIDRILGVSKAIQEVKTHLYRVASCSSNVLITGETGTGKELVAELIHRQSSRAGKPLIAINCAAIPDSLFESELFGFERGAFTGAHAAQDGKLSLAAGGTVFLDEIGDLSPYAQAKVLRAIETGEIQRLGGRRPQHIDVRVIAATNKNLETDPNFRRDLYFRLNVARIHLPPLRERKEDILPLVEAFRVEFDKTFGCATKAFLPRRPENSCWPTTGLEIFVSCEISSRPPSSIPDRMPKARSICPWSSGRPFKVRAAESWSEFCWRCRKRSGIGAGRPEELHWSRMTLYRKMARYKITRVPASE